MKDLKKITEIEDLRRVAERKVPRMFYDYVDSGSWTETTYRNNETDFDRIKLRQRVLVNMEGRSLATDMLGSKVKMPVGKLLNEKANRSSFCMLTIVRSAKMCHTRSAL